jgi:hypothetical protein
MDILVYLTVMDGSRYQNIWFYRLHVHHEAKLQIAIALKYNILLKNFKLQTQRIIHATKGYPSL